MVKDPVIIPDRLLREVIAELSCWEQASLNGGDPINLKDAKRTRSIINALERRRLQRASVSKH